MVIRGLGVKEEGFWRLCLFYFSGDKLNNWIECDLCSIFLVQSYFGNFAEHVLWLLFSDQFCHQ